MPFPFNMWPWNRDSDLNVAYWIKQLEEISRQAVEDLTTLEEWKTGLEQGLETWKSGVLSSISNWENEFTAAMALWKTETEGDLDDWKRDTQNDISLWKSDTLSDLNQWESDTLANLNVWKQTFLAQYETLESRVNAIVSSTQEMISNLAPAFSVNSNYKAGEYVIQNGILYKFIVDHTASAWNSQHAVPAVAMQEVQTIQDSLHLVESTSMADLVASIDLENKCLTTSGAEAAAGANSYHVAAFNVEEGATYFITASANWGNLLWAFYDSTRTMISASTPAQTSSAFTTITENTIVAPQNARLVKVSYNTTVAQGRVCKKTAYIAMTPSIDEENKCITNTGAVSTAGTNSYHVAKYSVKGGTPYWIDAASNWGNAFWCWYDDQDSVLSIGDTSAQTSAFESVYEKKITSPATAAYLRVAYNTTIIPGKCAKLIGLRLPYKWDDKKWVCVGDSLTEENQRTTKHYYDYVAEVTGIIPINMGESGTGYARRMSEGKAFFQRITSCPTDADVITIFGSFNDLGAGLPLGSVDDTGTTTIAGCINTTITNLQSIIPLAVLGIIAPTPWDTTQPSTSGSAYNYVEMLKAICERRSIPFLDLWRGSNLRPWDSDFRQLAYSHDEGSGTHPDENGHKIIAPKFEGFLDTLLIAY